jgi:hypothetical protein
VKATGIVPLASVGAFLFMVTTQRLLLPPLPALATDNLGLLQSDHTEYEVLKEISTRLSHNEQAPVHLAWQEQNGKYLVERSVTYLPASQSLFCLHDGQETQMAPITHAGIRSLLQANRQEGFAAAWDISQSLLRGKPSHRL